MTDVRPIAKGMVFQLLRATPAPTPADIRVALEAALLGIARLYPEETAGIDREGFAREIEAACNVYVPHATTLAGRGHVDWLPGRRADIQWSFWRRYEAYLRTVTNWEPGVVSRLDDTTDEVLRMIEDPRRPGSWDARGMVAGQVQSGKTAHYISLICKAADAGYKLIIILAGLFNSLRSQTQLRLDEGFLGFDTQKRMTFDQTNVRIGVGAMRGWGFFHAHSLTSSLQSGDFNVRAAQNAGIIPGGMDPVVLVVKKNRSVLENVIRWATLTLQQREEGSGRLVVPDVPLLVIDDEADHASVNTRAIPRDEYGNEDPDMDPTTINKLIRQLLYSFSQSAYVGYTATPFANIFIFHESKSEKHGEDLFPRSFIVNLNPPSHYLGPVEVFGLRSEPDSGLESKAGLPIIRQVDDYDAWIPDKHKKDHSPLDLPASLREAIHAFVLTCTVRALRGDDRAHNSMLVHVTRFTAVQKAVTEQLKEELRSIRRRLEFGEGEATCTVLGQLKGLWERDFQRTAEEWPLGKVLVHEWHELEPYLARAAAKIDVMTINGTAKDALEYYDHRSEGLSVIAVGGDKLSRGLTLEGLSVSYYLRASRMYDTLMQMGRWFGYRPNYEDLCRLYTTSELARWYADITAANEELRQEFDHMAALKATPMDFGLRVKSHPDGLLVTARAKLRDGLPMDLSFSRAITETIDFELDRDRVSRNLEVTEDFIRRLERQSRGESTGGDGGTVRWSEVPGDEVADFLGVIRTHPAARKARADLIRKYVLSRLTDEPAELTSWTVALISVRDGARRTIGGQEVGLVRRARFPEADRDALRYSIRRLLSPADELLDFGPGVRAELLRRTIDEAKGQQPPEQVTRIKVPSGPVIRSARDSRVGLLLLYPLDPPEDIKFALDLPIMGFGISFPESHQAKPISYMVNNVYWDQEFGEIQ